MKPTILLLSLAVATTCQAQALKPIEVFETVVGFFDNIGRLLGGGPSRGSVKFTAQIAFDQIGNNNKPDGSIPRYDPTGFLPMFYVYGPTEWVAWTNGFDYLKNGETWVKNVKMDNNQRHERFMVSWDKKDFANDDLCITQFGVVSSSGAEDEPPYAVLAENILLVQPAVSWYWSGQVSEVPDPDQGCNTASVPRRCAWGGRYSFKDRTSFITFNLHNVHDYAKDMNNGRPFLLSKDRLEVKIAPKWTKNMVKRMENATEVEAATAPAFDHIFVDDLHSAEELCKSTTSHGPSFVNTREGLFCDMDTKTLYPSCSTAPQSLCYTLVGEQVTIRPGLYKRRLADTMDSNQAVASAPSDHAIASSLNAKFQQLKTKPLRVKKHSLAKRACVPSEGKTSLAYGDKLKQNQYLHSLNGKYRLSITMDGNLVVHKTGTEPTGDNIWELRYHGDYVPYTADIKDNGQLCIRDGSANLKKCANAAIGSGGGWTLVLEDSGDLVIKNKAGQVKWSTNPNHEPEPTKIGGFEVDKTNSLFMNKARYGPFSLKAKNGNVKFDFDAKGVAKLSKDGKVKWTMEAEKSNQKYYFMVARRGGICSIADDGRFQKCIGDSPQNGDDEYVMVIANSGIVMLNTDGDLIWTIRADL